MSTLAEVIREQGAKSIADRLGVSIQRLSNWAERGVPIEWCARLEQATGLAWTRQQMRPDDAHLIWPDLAESEPNPTPAPADQAQADINKEAIGEGARV